MAAVIAFLALVTISPTRAWVVTSFRMVTSFFGDRGEVPIDQPALVLDAPTENQVRVGVPLSGEELTIRLASRQSSGRMTIEVVSGSNAFAEIVDGDVEELVVSDGLFIRNQSGSTSSYRVGVPLAVSTVTLRVGDEGDRRFSVKSLGVSWVVDLGALPNE